MRTKPALAAVVVLSIASRAASASCVPGFDFALFAKDAMLIQGNAGTDSYDSSLGSYAATRACTDASVGTNSTAGGHLRVHSGSTTVCGDAIVGAGGAPTSVVTGNGTITGDRTAQQVNLALPAVAAPALPHASPADRSSQNSHQTLDPDYTYGDVHCKNGSLTLNAGRYVLRSLQLQANCDLIVGSAPIEIYFTESLNLKAGVVVNASNVPADLVFFGTPTATAAQVQGGVDASFGLYAPNAECELHGNGDVFGALVCAEIHVQGNAHAHYDRALRNYEGGAFTCPVLEVSRATPIVATVASQQCIVQGTFEVPRSTKKTIRTTADVAGFKFPHILGHLRARTTASLSIAASSFSAGTVVFDAGAHGGIPAVRNAGCASFNGTCRNVFTVTQAPDAGGTSVRPPRVQLNDGNASAIGALIAPASVVPGVGPAHWQTIVRKVLAAKLGGVDRSTVAVIGASPVAGSTARPTIAYVGGADGMLHAVCASVGGDTESQSSVCPRLGAELWAFLPRVQLPLVRDNSARIDGSVHVVDAFDDFAAVPTGARSFRTILTLQAGSSGAATAAVYAIDVTDPADPVVLWESTAPAARAAFELGAGLTLAAGGTLVDGKPTNLVVAHTTNGGTGGAGVVATALSLASGIRRWQFGYAYPSPPRDDASTPPVPASGVPGGAVAVDLRRQGFTTDIVLGDLYGNLWRLDAATGTSRTGHGIPLFQFSTNEHPIGAMPGIYSDGDQQYAVFGSGGYVDPLGATWSAGMQSLIAIKLTATGPYPISETSSKLALSADLVAGDRVFAQVLVVGDQLFVTTDATDVNASGFGTNGSTGHVIRYDLAGDSSQRVVVRGGASSVVAATTTLYSASSDEQQRLATEATSSEGPGVDTMTAARLVRQLWLRMQ